MESSRRDLLNDVAEHRFMLKNKGEVRILVVFQDRRSATSFQRPRRELPFDVAEHRSFL